MTKGTARKRTARKRTAPAEQDQAARTIGVATDAGGRVLVDDGGRPVQRTEADQP